MALRAVHVDSLGDARNLDLGFDKWTQTAGHQC